MNQPQVSPIMAAHYKGQKEVVDALLSTNPTLSVFEVAALGDTRQLQVHLESEPNTANAFAVDGFSPLHLACFMGQYRTARTPHLQNFTERSQVISSDGSHTISIAGATRSVSDDSLFS